MKCSFAFVSLAVFLPLEYSQTLAFSFVSPKPLNTIKSATRLSMASRSSSLGSSTKQKKKKLKTFLRYLEVESWKNEDIRELETVFMSIGDACKQMNKIVQRAQTDDIYGAATIGVDGKEIAEDGTNVQGEVQQKLDVLCNTIFLRALCGCSTDKIAAVASEEEDLPRCCGDVMGSQAFAEGRYVAVFDPLDGSKNIDASLPVGTIFGIYKAPTGVKADVNTFLDNGSELVAAGYCLYSSTTVLVLTTGSGVDGFTLDPDKGIFLHTLEDMRIPSKGSIYSFNEANFHDYEEPIQKFLESLKVEAPDKPRSSARYVGALVADVHNILTNGGIYGYPATRKDPNGKLRLMYESCPMAMILEQAGGAGSTGTGRILNVKRNDIHQRVPTFLGSLENVFELNQFFKYYGDEKNEEA